MSVKETKHKIIRAAIHLFNEEGVVNVRLQQIADASVFSLGHMAYHFKNKEGIVFAIWEELMALQKVQLAEFRVVPLFEDVERQLEGYFEIQQQYSFFYNDMLEVIRAYPEIAKSYRQHLMWQESQVQMMIQFNQSRGAFIPQLELEIISPLTRLYWQVADTWMYRQRVSGLVTTDYASFREAIWSLLKPWMSPTGRAEYHQLLDAIQRKNT